MDNRWINWLILTLVFLAHGAVLGAVALWPSESEPVIAPPSITGIIIPAPPAEVVQAPAAQKPIPEPEPEPKPKPEPKPEPKPLPEPKPKPKPVDKPVAKPATPPPEPTPSQPKSQPPLQQETLPEETLPEKNLAEKAEPPPTASIDSEAPNQSQGAPVTPPREDAQIQNNPRPAYPRASLRRGEQGTVLLELLILADGSVAEVEIKESSGYVRLDRTAVKAAKKWRYVPAKRGEVAIAYRYLQPVSFSLNN